MMRAELRRPIAYGDDRSAGFFDGDALRAVVTYDLGYGPDDRLHSPNEKMSIPQFYDGIRCNVRLLDRVAEIGA